MRQTNRPLTTLAVILAIGLAAVEATIVSTAMPTIASQLGGISLYGWVFSAYLLTSAATVPIYGRLADLYGRKSVLMVGTGIFLAGSALSGLANSTPQLIAFRAVQGLGAGAVLPVATTIIGDIYTLAERARMQGIFSAVWGVAAISGPALGGLLVDQLSWRWIFYINLPVGIAAMLLLAAVFHERIEHRRVKVDYAGSALLTAAVASLLALLLLGGDAFPWVSAPSGGLLTLASGLTAAFLTVERRAENPILPFDLFRLRLITLSNAGSLLVGGLVIAATSQLPLFTQGILGYTATGAGTALVPMSVLWTFGSVISGQLLVRVGYRTTALAGALVTAVGAGALTRLPSLSAGATGLALPMATAATMGLGFGLAALTYTVGAQSAVDWRRRGVATASVQFTRTLGSTVWAALLGGLLNAGLRRSLQGLPAPLLAEARRISESPALVDAVTALVDPSRRALLGPATAEALRQALASALGPVFWAVLATALAHVVIGWLLPSGLAVEAERKEGAAS